MKRLLVLALGLMVIGLAFSPAYADSNTSGAAHVLVNVNPIIAITPVPQASIPTVQLGKFIVPISWLIGANAQQVALTLEASALFKADDPTSPSFIPVDPTTAVAVLIPNGNAINGAANSLGTLTVTTSDTISGFPLVSTGTTTFQSSQAGTFSQTITTNVPYNQSNNELPKGQYSGWVKLLGVIVPDP